MFLRWVQKHTLTIIALFASMAMTSMIVYQQHVIDSQRLLIQQLYGDSLELTARKVHDLQVKRNGTHQQP